jgi:hypothetical protein
VLERHRDKGMEKTFMMWETILLNDLHVLERLTGLDEMSRMRYAMKEQEIGLHCYQAEENLTDAELALLKNMLRLSDLRWHLYKSRLRPTPE